MCQKKPGLRCATHALSRLESLQKQQQQALKTQNQSKLPQLEQEISKAQFEYNLTQHGLSAIENSEDLSQFKRIRFLRERVAKSLEPSPPTITTVPPEYRINGTEGQYEKIGMEAQHLNAKEQDLRARLTENINMHGPDFSQELYHKTQETIERNTNVQWYKNLVSVIKDECDRQHVGADRVKFLSLAYEEAYTQSQTQPYPTLEDMEHYAGVLEPDSRGRVRFTNVTFANGGTAASGDAAHSSSSRLFSLLDNETDADDFVYSYLSIHPFEDGNGRSAWLLRTWLKDEWHDPQPLPYYQF